MLIGVVTIEIGDVPTYVLCLHLSLVRREGKYLMSGCLNGS